MNLGLLEVDLTDSLISRVIDTLVTDFPQLAVVAPVDDHSASIFPVPNAHLSLNFHWDGLNASLAVKQDIT